MRIASSTMRTAVRYRLDLNRTHVRILLRELDPALDIDVLAHVLLAPFRAELYAHLVSGQPAGRERLLAVVRSLLDGLGRAWAENSSRKSETIVLGHR